MSTINVQFSDSTEKTIVAYFSGPQSASAYQNFGTVDASDARWAAFYAAQGAQTQALLPSP
ncbi:hypothetical protein [Burkholderia ubonensis]|uniref:hypothetical protein n=1 Tax=Burkholderia ubonensis TaxID=101571 RepID=UPI000A7BDF63|nr:hypothetical protein [Burkholderia ubonensis]